MYTTLPTSKKITSPPKTWLPICIEICRSLYNMVLFISVVNLSSGPVEYCQDEVFHAKCDPGHVVKMMSASYGRMQLGRCMTEELGVIGCSLPVVPYVGERCSGHQICEFPVAELQDNQPCPDFVPSYLATRYQCVLGKLLAPFIHSFIFVYKKYFRV